jgi:hypothetical protein
MKGVALYGRVRYAMQIEWLSHREAARRLTTSRTLKASVISWALSSQLSIVSRTMGCGRYVLGLGPASRRKPRRRFHRYSRRSADAGIRLERLLTPEKPNMKPTTLCSRAQTRVDGG